MHTCSVWFSSCRTWDSQCGVGHVGFSHLTHHATNCSTERILLLPLPYDFPSPSQLFLWSPYHSTMTYKWNVLSATQENLKTTVIKKNTSACLDMQSLLKGNTVQFQYESVRGNLAEQREHNGSFRTLPNSFWEVTHLAQLKVLY